MNAPLTSSLLEQTRGLLKQALDQGIKLKDIHRFSRGRLEYEWLRKMARGEVADPSVTRVETLHGLLAHLLRMPGWEDHAA